jgi:aryl-alcohol dehydrogenase-like predicted oxidoreductase
MITQRLGRTGMDVTPIGLGTWAIGGVVAGLGWGPQDDRDSIAAIHAALDAGINWLDTAPVYGGGHSEEIVGRALREVASPPMVFTKCGRVLDLDGKVRPDLSAGAIRTECDASLARLGVEVIDLYQIHWPTPTEQLEEAWTTLAELRAEGKVRHIGGSNFDREQLELCERIVPVETLQPPYSLLRRDIEAEILPWCGEHELGVLSYAPMHSGLLTGSMTAERAAALPSTDWRSRNPEFQEPKLSENLALVERLRAIGAPAGATPGQVAIAWALEHERVDAVIVGARAPGQIGELAAAVELRLGVRDVLA